VVGHRSSSNGIGILVDKGLPAARVTVSVASFTPPAVFMRLPGLGRATIAPARPSEVFA